MTNSDFRKLLSTPRAADGAQVAPKGGRRGGGGDFQKPKPRKPAPRPAKPEEVPEGPAYRDRAKERREESAPEYKKRMQALVNPDNWPPPPPYTQPLSWLRARFLYALIPADKNATYKQNVKPWSPPALGTHPGTSR